MTAYDTPDGRVFVTLDEAAAHALALPDKVSQEAVCNNCGEDIIVPWDEDPDDTLCVACAEEEQAS